MKALSVPVSVSALTTPVPSYWFFDTKGKFSAGLLVVDNRLCHMAFLKARPT